MSRLDSAIDSIQNAVDDLRGALETHLKEAAHSTAQMQADGAMINEDELRAMKSELHEAMNLLHAMQEPAPDSSQDSGQDSGQEGV